MCLVEWYCCKVRSCRAPLFGDMFNLFSRSLCSEIIARLLRRDHFYFQANLLTYILKIYPTQHKSNRQLWLKYHIGGNFRGCNFHEKLENRIFAFICLQVYSSHSRISRYLSIISGAPYSQRILQCKVL